MKGKYHRKQILLFLISVLLPSLILVFLTARMISQEQELAQSRLSEERSRVAREIGQHFLFKLENIKLHETSAISDLQDLPAGMNYANPEVVMICLVDGRQPVLPWENSHGVEEAKLYLYDQEFVEMIREAEREEIALDNFQRAADLYGHIINTAEHSLQKEYAGLLQARTLLKSGQETAALASYRQILRLPYTVSDEYGIPLSLYAASPLLEYKEEHSNVLSHIQNEVQKKHWLSPSASYLLLNVLDESLRNDPHGIDKKAIEDIKDTMQTHIRKLEQAEALQRDFPGLVLIINQDEQIQEPLWISYGANRWLISLSSSLPGKPGYLIVVSIEKIFFSLKSDSDFRQSFPVEFNVVPEGDPDGLMLGRNVQGLGITFKEGEERIFQTPLIIRPAFYLPALLLILGITLFGAYLLWRDVRREVQVAEMRSQFVSSVSHELKTPLTSIRMFAETLRLDRSKDAKTKMEYLDTIVNESQRLTRLLNNVLDLSKIEQGKRIYSWETAALYEIVDSTIRTIEYPLNQQGFTLDVQVDDGLPHITVDRDAMEQALLNLLHNAMKYSGDSRRIGLHLRKENGFALFQVTDHGIGIEPQEQKKIFQKFYRIPSTENQRITGTGLGLALVSHIVEAHGGYLSLESEPGKGSIFSIYIPLEAES